MRARLALAVPLLLAGLAGCLGDQAEAPTTAMDIPALPSVFRAVYEDRDGNELVVEAKVHESLNRHAELTSMRLVHDDKDRVWGFDACGPPVWIGERDDGRISMAPPFISPTWLMVQGLTLRPGMVLERFVSANATVFYLADNEVSVEVGGFVMGPSRYDGRPVPVQWTDTDQTRWSLAEYSGEPAGACAAPAPAQMGMVGRDGPLAQPTHPGHDLPSVLAEARGPLGPVEFQQWEADHPDGWLASAYYSPPLLTTDPTATVLKPAYWGLSFHAPHDAVELHMLCLVDERDRMGLHLNPRRCSTGTAENHDLESSGPATALPDPAGLERTLAALGLAATTYSFGSSDMQGSVRFEVWEAIPNGYNIYHLGLDEDGRMAWSSLPGRLDLLG